MGDKNQKNLKNIPNSIPDQCLADHWPRVKLTKIRQARSVENGQRLQVLGNRMDNMKCPFANSENSCSRWFVNGKRLIKIMQQKSDEKKIKINHLTKEGSCWATQKAATV